jgi:chromosome segregation ATPase
METLDLVKLLIEGGIAGILGTGLVVVWRTWRASVKRHGEELQRQGTDYQAVIDQKNKVIEQLANQVETITKNSGERLDRMVQMIADGGTATQGVLADNAAAMATNQQALQDVKGELLQLRQSVDRIRGGG